jgi:ankyrin repeat domain-containing protein 50
VLFDEAKRLFKPHDVLKYLPGLVSIVPILIFRYGNLWDRKKAEVVELAHFSIKEYLISERIREGPAAKFSIIENDAHLHVSESCLAYHLQISETELATKESVERFAL